MRIRRQRSLPVLVLGLVMNSSVLAELAVIYDSGETRPLAPLLSPLLSKKTQSTAPAESNDQNPSSKSLLGPATLSNLLPIRSPGLAVGDTTDSQLNPETLARLAQGNPRPFFLIGSDALSVQWLVTHHDTLKALGAVGMLVQADTEADVRRVAEAAQGLSITLGSGSDLAAALGIHHYPVLITRDGIRQ